MSKSNMFLNKKRLAKPKNKCYNTPVKCVDKEK